MDAGTKLGKGKGGQCNFFDSILVSLHVEAMGLFVWEHLENCVGNLYPFVIFYLLVLWNFFYMRAKIQNFTSSIKKIYAFRNLIIPTFRMLYHPRASEELYLATSFEKIHIITTKTLLILLPKSPIACDFYAHLFSISQY